MNGLAYPSALVIFGMNLIPLVLVFTGRWDAFTLLAAYWWEGLLLSLSTLIKISITRSNAPRKIRGEFDIFDLPVAVYVPFIIVFGLVALWFFRVIANNPADLFQRGAWGGQVMAAWTGLWQHGLPVYVSILAARFGYSLYTNFFRHREYLLARMLVRRSLIRVFSIEFMAAMMVGASFANGWFPLWAAAAGVMIIDIFFHLIERAAAFQPNHPSDVDYTRGG